MDHPLLMFVLGFYEGTGSDQTQKRGVPPASCHLVAQKARGCGSESVRGALLSARLRMCNYCRMATQIGQDIWTVDGPDVVFSGVSMNTRMTIARLRDGKLWIHSPIELSDATKAVVDDLGGAVAALIAPNKYHHLFIDRWLDLYPDAGVFAHEELIGKVPSLAHAEILTNTAPGVYSGDVDQVIFEGNRMFQEVVFFHRPSRSVIFTDLVQNLRTDGVKLLPRLYLKLDGVAHPHGGVPRLFKWFTTDRRKARAALRVIKSWEPRNILFCHGEPIAMDAGELLDREFAYLD